MPFRIALSGLNAASADLNVTANNIANVNTAGFKQSRSEFADVLGKGVRLAATPQEFAQGNVNFTDNELDLAITGNGFFTLSDGGSLVYSRAGSFSVDNEGFVVNSAGAKLQVYPAAGQGIFDIGTLQDLRLNTAENSPQATTEAEVGVNLEANSPVPTNPTFDSTDPSSFNSTTSVTIYDSLGGTHVATYYFVKDAPVNEWTVHLLVDGNPLDAGQTLTFGTDGALTSPAGGQITYPPYDPGTGASPLNLTVDYGLSTQFGGDFTVNVLNQDGYSTGRLTGIGVSPEGAVFARFSNGRSTELGQIALTNFTNLQGLDGVGDNSWAETFESGQALRGEAGSASFGIIQSGALEASNVDLTEQLVNMIEAQRNFQANAQMMSTADAVTQTIINNIR